MATLHAILHHPTPDIADHRVSGLVRDTWAEAAVLSSPWVVVAKNVRVSVEADWSQVAAYQVLAHGVEMGAEGITDLDAHLAPLRAAANPVVTISIETSGGEVPPDAVQRQFAEQYMCEMWLVLNLAMPSSLNLGFWTLASPDETSSGVVLHGTIFEGAWGKGHPQLQRLPLAATKRWFDEVSLGIAQVADTPVRRALYCLLHLAAVPNLEPSLLIWMTHGLEALFQVPAALSQSVLKRRVEGLLDMPPAASKAFGKRLRRLYDARNAFAHGGMAIPHVLSNDMFDSRYDAHVHELVDSQDFGVRVLVASLQALVLRRTVALTFREEIEFSSFGPVNSVEQFEAG